MAHVLNTQTNEVVEVPDDQVTGLVASGKAMLPKGEISVISPDGKAGTIDEAEAAEAFANGFRFQTAADTKDADLESKYGNAPVPAAALGVGRGATLGLSDAYARMLGAPAEYLKETSDRNQAASVGGEVVGTIGSLLIPGAGEVTGPGLAAKAGRLAEGLAARGGSGLAAKLAGKAAAGAVEGTLYGAGHAISEESLGGHEVTAEKILAGAGIGAIAGGATNAALGGAGEGLSRLIGKVIKGGGAASATRQGLSERLKEYAEERAVKAVAGNGHLKALRGLDNKGILNEVGRHAMDEGILTAGATADDILARAEASVEKHGKRISDALTTADGQASSVVRGDDIASKIEAELVAPLRKGNVGDQAIADRIAKEAEFIRAKGDLGFRDASDLKRSYDKFLDFGSEQKPVQEQLKRVRGIINGEVDAGIDSVGAGLGDEYKSAKKAFRLSSELKDLAEERSLQLRNNRSFSPSDYGMGGIGAVMGGGPVGVATGVAAGVGNKILRERGPQALAIALDKLADSSLIQSLSKGFASSIGKTLESSPQAFGRYSSVLAGAAARGADDLLSTHVQLAKADPEYRDVMAKAGFPEETPDEAIAYTRRAGGLAATKDAIDEHDRKVDTAIGRFLGTQAGAAPRGKADVASLDARTKAFQQRYDALSKMLADPQAMIDRMQPGALLSDAAPGVAAAASLKAAAAAQFLHEKAPKDPSPQPVAALARPWKPSASELTRWERYAETIDNPMSVMASLKRCNISKEAVEALQAVYPNLLEDIRSKTLERISTHPTRLSPSQRASLSVLMGQPMGGTSRLGEFQQMHAEAQQQEAQKQARASSDAHKQAQGLATSSQRIEGR